jgi:hypothetical protein
LSWTQKAQFEWWRTPVIPALERQREKDQKFQASQGHIVRSCLKNQKAEVGSSRSKVFLGKKSMRTHLKN